MLTAAWILLHRAGWILAPVIFLTAWLYLWRRPAAGPARRWFAAVLAYLYGVGVGFALVVSAFPGVADQGSVRWGWVAPMAVALAMLVAVPYLFRRGRRDRLMVVATILWAVACVVPGFAIGFAMLAYGFGGVLAPVALLVALGFAIATHRGRSAET